MTWDISVRHEIRGVLACPTAVHVGGWDPTAMVDLPIARDGLDQPVIPGTSVAGALRAWLASVTGVTGQPRFDQRDIDALFGHVQPRTQAGSAALIRVDDAQLVDTVQPVARDGVAIDRRTAAAAAGFLFEREVLPAGTRFGFRLVADEPRAPAGARAVPVAAAVELLVAGLRAGRIPIGAARSRGLGQVALTDVQARATDLSQRDGLLAWLAGTSAWQPATASAPQPPGDGQLVIDIDWTPASPLLVKDSLEGTVIDTLPMTEATAGGDTRLLLPGSSTKGVLRAHAERIVRTLDGIDAHASLRDVLARERLVTVDTLFGAPPRDAEEEPQPVPQAPADPGRRAALVVSDCHSVAGVPAETWNEIITAHPSAARETDGNGSQESAKRESAKQARERSGEARDAERTALRAKLAAMSDRLPLQVTDHVAIDRWTGGAAENLLFSVLAPVTGLAWEPLRLRLDTRRMPAAGAEPHLALALLLLVLRDLADGWLALGYGGTRGRGQLDVRSIRFSGIQLPEPWSALPGRHLDEVLAAPAAPVSEAMRVWAERFPAKEDTR
jgi:CRISPR/Cas system CSM-associated protein Csm3 (group 7 of RAMP superfamily)